jgi:hypothetical protein
MHQGKYVPGTKKDELVLQGDHRSDFLELQWLFKEKTLKRAFARRSHLSVGSQKQEVEGILAGMRVAGGEKARQKQQYKRWEGTLKEKKEQVQELKDQRFKDEGIKNVTALQQPSVATKEEIVAAIHTDDRAMGAQLGGPDGSIKNAGCSDLQEYVMMCVVEELFSRLDLATVLLAKAGDAADDPEMNYLMIGPVLRFKVNRSKCDRSFAEREKKKGNDPFRVLTPSFKLQRILKQFLRVCGKRPGDFLMCKGDGKPLHRKMMSEHIKRFFKRKLKKGVTMTVWRKVKPTSDHSENRKAMERDAHVSGHSMATQAAIYNIVGMAV